MVAVSNSTFVMSSKGKAKRAEIRRQSELLNQKRKQIQDCEEIEDALELVPMFKKFDRNGLKATLVAVKQCPEEFEACAFELIEHNMKQIYENTWGWKPEAKEAELLDESARFIFAFVEEKPEPVGFIHYRFELDRAETSAFIYDIQLEEAYRGKGLGKWLLQSVEFIALKLKLDCVIVTLFKENTIARGFFRHMKYVHHSSSPAVADPENDMDYDHEVLFKSLVKKA